MITLIALFLRVAVLAVLTFGFVVLFEHGLQGFVPGITTEFHSLVGFVENVSGQSIPLSPKS